MADFNTIDYITIATTGNATDFGDLLTTKKSMGSVSDGEKGVFAGGGGAGSTDTIEYITIATTGNATDFGNLTAGRDSHNGGCSNGVRGVFVAGEGGDTVIDYITIATTGNATDFGDTLSSTFRHTSTSDAIRGLIGSGSTSYTSVSSVIQYITIDTTGNATDFGDLTVNRETPTSTCNGTIAVFVGGRIYSGAYTFFNTIEYVTVQTTGNAVDFGDLTVARSSPAGTSGN